MRRKLGRPFGTTLTAVGIALSLAAGSITASQAWAFDVKESKSYYDRAVKEYSKGDLRAATIELRNALKANPDNADARLLLADIYLSAGQGVAAQSELEAARKLGISREATRLRMGKALLQQQQFQRALTELDMEQLPDAEKAEAQEMRGLAYIGLGDDKTALETLLKSREADPKRSSIHIALARYYANKKQVDEAQKSIDAALALAPDDAVALVVKGDMVRSTQGLEAALPYFNHAVEANDKNLAARLERAATLVDLRRDEEAQRDIDVVAKAVPNHPLANYLTAVMRARKGDFAGADELMNRTKGALDGYLPAMQFRGVLSYQLGQLEQAATYLSKVIEQVPGSAVARRIYGATLLRQGNPKAAADQIKPLIDAGQDDSPLLALYGMALSQMGQYQKAMTYFENAVAKSPDQSALRTQLAISQMALGDPKSASKELDTVLKMDPESMQAMIMLTLIDLRSGNYDKALANAKTLIEKHKDQPLGYNMVGAAYLGKGEMDSAERYFKLSLEKDPDYHEARRNLAQLYKLSGKLDEARRQYLRVLESDRSNAKTMLALADLARMEGRTEDVIEWLNKAVQAKPDDLQPRLQLISTYLGINDRNRALNEALATERDFPENPAAVEAVGRAYGVAEDYDKAVQTFGRLVSLQPNQMGPRRLLARAQWKAGHVDDARATYRRALGLEGNNGEILIDLIQLEREQGNFEKAHAYAGELRQAYPNMNVADTTIGNLYMQEKKWGKAIEAYERARGVEDNKAISVALHQAYMQAGKPDKAIAVLQEWSKRDPNDLSVKVAIAGIHMQEGRYDEALQIYEKLQGNGEENPAILNNMAYIYQKKNDKRMVETAARAYELNRDSPQIADTYGWILVKEGVDKRLGLELLQRAAGALIDVPEIQYHLAYAFNENGKTAAARDVLEKALSGDPQFEGVAEAKALLKTLKGGN